MHSYRTTTVAILGAVLILGRQAMNVLDTDPLTVFDLNQVIEAFTMLGIGLFARDNKVTSEQAGAK